MKSRFLLVYLHYIINTLKQKHNMNDANKKYYISDSYPMIKEEVIEIEENNNIEIIVEEKHEINEELIYVPWQIINEKPIIL